MNEFMQYMLKSTGFLTVFYLFYLFALRKETFFGFNRAYLLIFPLISFVLPFLNINLSGYGSSSFTAGYLEPIIIGGSASEKAISGLPSFVNMVLVIYLIMILLFIIILLTKLFKLWVIIRNHRYIDKKYYRLVYLSPGYSPFSFFRYIFLPANIKEDAHFSRIITHETVHTAQWHSVDIIFSELISVIFWFNPAAWHYRKLVRENHEYLADNYVIRKSADKRNYQKSLLEITASLQFSYLTNSFNQSLILRRFKMMEKSPSSLSRLFKALLVLPVIGLMIVSFSGEFSAKEKKPANEEQFKKVEKHAEFIGGTKALQEFIIKEIKYPEAARKDGWQAKVIVTFVVDKAGSVKDVKVSDPTNMKRPGGKKTGKPVLSEAQAKELLEAEAVRVVKTMPKMKPATDKGNPVEVAMKIPIQFKLKDGPKK